MKHTGGKRKVNKSLKSWVAFVKKVQKQEKLSYKDAIHRAKVRKDKGEKWMTGGDESPVEETPEAEVASDETPSEEPAGEEQLGGKKRRRSRKRRQSRKNRKSRRR
jgi:hypothetical protein